MSMSLSVEQGWLTGVRRCPSSNFNERPEGITVNLLVIHNINLPAGSVAVGHNKENYIDDLFCNCLDISAHPSFAELAGLRVSAHFLLSRQGQVTQYVPVTKRAWHAGVSHWLGRENCNDFSIGIELEGADDVPYTHAQYQTLAQLTHLLRQLYPAITAEQIVGHSDIAPGRKTDPGPSFDWSRYRALLSA